MNLVLASSSPARALLLRNAGLSFTAIPANVDEEALKAARPGLPPAALASVLADAKAAAVSAGHSQALVIGADQVLDLEGETFGKPASLEAARRQLLRLRGRRHRLETTIACARAGTVLWRHRASPSLLMRAFGEEFLDDYLGRCGPALLKSAGSYQLESLGIQLFEEIDADYFAILGLPLLPLLAYLRTQGFAAT